MILRKAHALSRHRLHQSRRWFETVQQVRLRQTIYGTASLFVVGVGKESDGNALTTWVSKALARGNQSCVPRVLQAAFRA
jgi:hypothetical protein